MFGRYLFTTAIAAAVATGPATKVNADAGDIVGGVIGGIVGGLVVNEANKKKSKPAASAAPKSTASSAAVAANREVQTSLNYFGFEAGVVDGIVGNGTRRAISAYQAHLGFPATGQSTPYERDFLVTSYQRAQAGVATTAQLVAANPMGTKGLLTTYHQEALGLQPQVAAVPQTAQAGSVAIPQTVVAPAGAAPVTAAPAAAAPALPQLASAPATAAPATAAPALPQFTTTAPAEETTNAAAPALPNLFGGSTERQSLAAHCNTVGLLTSSNGFMTADNITDPSGALDEQLCLARTYAVAEGEQLIAKVSGFTPEQIEAQCDAIGPAMANFVRDLETEPAEAIMVNARNFASGSGLAPEQLTGTAKICLSVGYRTDAMDIALSSAIILSALGERGYGELLGHHLAQGFGTAESLEMAMPWYDMSFAAADAGETPVVAPGDPGRIEIVRNASYALSGREMAEETAPALPVFQVEN